LIQSTAPVKNAHKKNMKQKELWDKIGSDEADIYKFLTTGNSKMKA
jgi:DNA-binding Xre family transcriptional regulator